MLSPEALFSFVIAQEFALEQKTSAMRTRRFSIDKTSDFPASAVEARKTSLFTRGVHGSAW